MTRNETVYVVSFPKSGRTWLRVMLGEFFNLHYTLGLEDDKKRLFQVEKLHRWFPQVPEISFTHGSLPSDSNKMKKSGKSFHPYLLSAPQIVDHDEFRALCRDANIIFLSRDPRDVVVSSYYQRTLREPSFRRWKGDGISEYIRDDAGSFKSILAFYNVWWDTARHLAKRSILLRYEDLHEDPIPHFKRLLTFLNVEEPAESTIRSAIEFSSFESMKAMEEKNEFHVKELKMRKENNPDSVKVREGRIGGYVGHVQPEDAAWMTSTMKESLRPVYGYE
eukprot:TRINITY_DN2481_c0_g1_i1.p1 TRINITY_DN2481_c0_g1~~TRINITY_DN2481_c0_g1_i1.p1  ORF type:complete len:278 (+),score=41.76 TRINITY_DN2481_c0_g1_i1:687-1520(+)